MKMKMKREKTFTYKARVKEKMLTPLAQITNHLGYEAEVYPDANSLAIMGTIVVRGVNPYDRERVSRLLKAAEKI